MNEYNKDNKNYVEKYNKLIWHFAHCVKNDCPFIEIEDVRQSLIFKLLTSIDYIDEEKGNETTYVYAVLQNEASFIKKSYYGPKNQYFLNMLSYKKLDYDMESNDDLLLNEEEDIYFNPEEVFKLNQAIEYIDLLMDSYPKSKREIVRKYLSGVEVSSLAKEYSMSEKNIYNCINKFRELLEKYLK